MAGTRDIPFATRELRGFLHLLDRVVADIRRLEAGEPPAENLPVDPKGIRALLAGRLTGMSDRAEEEELDPASPAFLQARAVIARLGDRTLEALDWPEWEALAPLEESFPAPSGGGDTLLEQARGVLAPQRPDAELAELYLLALSLPEGAGDAGGEADPAEIRRRLAAVVEATRPALAMPPPKRLTPAAYQGRRRRGPVLYLPRLLPWGVALMATSLLLLAVSFVIWGAATGRLHHLLAHLLESLG